MPWLAWFSMAIMGFAAAAAGQAMGPPSRGAPAQAGESLPATTLPLELVGVMTDSADPARSACLVRCTFPVPRRSASNLRTGETACDLAEIKEIRQDTIVIR